jgi:protein TonB
MTVVHLPMPHRDDWGLRRWGVSLAVIAALHAVGLFVAVTFKVPLQPPPPPAEPIMLDLEPLPAPPPPPEPPPPEPPPPAAEIPPPPPDPEPPPPPEKPPEVVLPKPPPPPPVIHKPVVKKPPPIPRPVQAVPQPQPDIPPPPVPMPARPAAPQVSVDPMAAYRATLGAILKSHLRYPIPSRQRHEEGTTTVEFTLDRNGRLVDATIVHGSGHELLDQEALAMLRRASPFPPPPGVDSFHTTVPVIFDLR